jgi:hypothetical protein
MLNAYLNTAVYIITRADWLRDFERSIQIDMGTYSKRREASPAVSAAPWRHAEPGAQVQAMLAEKTCQGSVYRRTEVIAVGKRENDRRMKHGLSLQAALVLHSADLDLEWCLLCNSLDNDLLT